MCIPDVRKQELLSHDELLSLMRYDPETGEMTWVNPPMKHKHKAGKRVGCCDPAGYVKTSIRGERYLLHRLAWFYVHKEWPPHVIDHIDGNRTNNRLSNLRAVEQKINIRNRKTRGWVLLPNGRYRARVFLDGRLRFDQCFATAEEAEAASQDFRARYGQ